MKWQLFNKNQVSRQYRYRVRHRRRRRLRWGRVAVAVAAAGAVVFCLVKIIGYGAALFSSRRTSEELREAYYAVPTDSSLFPAEAQNEAPSFPQSPFAYSEQANAAQPTAAEAAAAPAITPSPTALPAVAADYSQPGQSLKPVSYPNNPTAQISSVFQALRRECPDAVGWLKINGMVDEAVVQRDNVFYLDHDAKGQSNINGSLFMDAAVSMKTRPYTLLIYGHNMKSGAMFGKLRNYENVSYYRSNPVISFNSAWEDGQYVVFAAGIIGMKAEIEHYVNFFSFTTAKALERESLIDTLMGCSVFSTPVDVTPEDQLLVLVTCVDDDDLRRVVAARRLRDGETEGQLKIAVAAARGK